MYIQENLILLLLAILMAVASMTLVFFIRKIEKKHKLTIEGASSIDFVSGFATAVFIDTDFDLTSSFMVYAENFNKNKNIIHIICIAKEKTNYVIESIDEKGKTKSPLIIRQYDYNKNNRFLTIFVINHKSKQSYLTSDEVPACGPYFTVASKSSPDKYILTPETETPTC